MKNLLAILALFLGIVVMVACLCMVFAWPFIWIWNYAVVGTITVCNPIENFWVGFWLMMFISIFVKASSSSRSS